MSTASSAFPLSSDFQHSIKHDHHSYCIYLPVTILGLKRHSLETHDRLQEEQQFVGPSFFPDTNKAAEPPPFVSATNSPVASTCAGTLPNRKQRSLTAAAITLYDEMNAFVAEPPGPPPSLSGSKSSKSSSFQSSSLSGTDGILSDITHFEDIGLDEDHQSFHQNHGLLYGMEKSMRPFHHGATTTMGGNRSSTGSMTTMRELTNAGNRLPYPQTQGYMKGHTAAHPLGLPNGGGPRRGIRSPSTPSLAIMAMSNRNRSRSPSPNAPSVPFANPLPSPTSRKRPGLEPIDMKKLPARRGSWQPSRKSIKELEAEYNDEDEDLPEDASLWNVPLSPRPPEERTTPMISKSASSSPKASPRTSPERRNPLRASIGMTTIQAPQTAPPVTATSPLSNSMESPPNSPKKPQAIRGASTGTLPDYLGPQATRTKSWNVALSELSEDAKSLTEAFENHAIDTEKKHEEAVQSGDKSVRSSVDKLSRTKTSVVELPPLRINNIMIDPLPVSKEKEKVLSRTRPSWLPPKSKKEEQKHLKEYQRMMESSLEAEKRRAAQVADSRCANDDTKSALLRIWEEHVLPNWDQVVREPRTRELWWRGVAPKSRAQVWQKAIGNDLALTEQTYWKALQRVKDTETKIAKPGNEDCKKEKTWFDAIRRDVKVIFPELNIFQPGGPLHNDLVDVLMAYSMYRSDVGYSHGTHLIAALLSLTFPTPHATFCTLANLLNRPLPLAFLTGDPTGTAKAYQLTDGLLSHKFPCLHTHLFAPAPDGLGLTAHEVFEPMMRTLFLGPSGSGLGVEIAARVWDVMVFDGDSVIIRAAVAALGALEGTLYGDAEEVLDVLGWRSGSGSGGATKGTWNVGGEEAFMAKVRAAGKEEKGRLK